MNQEDNNQSISSKAGLHFASQTAQQEFSTYIEQCDNPGEQWELVKKNASRTVYRRQLGQQQVYLKHFYGQSFSHKLRRLFRHSDAIAELQYALYLSSQGVETVQPLAARFDGKQEWLLTKEVAPALPLDEWHAERLQQGRDGQKAIRQITAAMGDLIGRMHKAGVAHWDLHCGNVMVQQTEGGKGYKLILMDLHRMQRRRRLPRRIMAANLAQLFHDRYHFTTRTDRLRFLKHYARECGRAGSLRGWQLLVEGFAADHTHRQNRQRDRRTLKKNKYFSPIQLPDHWSGHVVLASKRHMSGSKAAEMTFTRQQWNNLLQQPDALFEGDDVQVIKDTKTSKIVRRPLQIGDQVVDVFIKRARQKKFHKRIVDMFRMSRSKRAFILGHKLLTRRISTALPLAALERRVGLALTDNIFITEAIHDGQHLDKFMKTWLAIPPRGDEDLTPARQYQLAQEVLWQLGRMLQNLHDNNFAHRDLKATNIHVRWDGEHRPEIVLVDLDGLSHVRFLTARRKLQGLMRLNVSLLLCPAVNRPGQLRMLLGYLRRPGCGKIAFKPYWRVLDEWSARKRRKQIRSRQRRQKELRKPA